MFTLKAFFVSRSVRVLRPPSLQCRLPWSGEPTNIEARETLIRRTGFVHFSFPRGAGSCFRKPFKILERTTVPPKYRNSYLRRLLVSFGLFLALLAWREPPEAKMHLISLGPGFRCACSAARRLFLSPRCRIFRRETVCG